MQALIEFFTGMKLLDAVLVSAALIVFFGYMFICAAQLLSHEVSVFRGEIDPEEYEEEGDNPDDEDENWY